MLTMQSAPVIGSTKRSGIWIPGVLTIGGGKRLDSINLLSSVLDPRITFTGPPHFYWTADNVLVTSDENVWPLEYRNGLVVGRHEPEPSATNYQRLMRGNVATSSATGAWRTTLPLGTGIGPDGGNIGEVSSSYDLYAVYNATNSSWILEQTTPEVIPDFWNRIVVPFTLTAAAQIRTYTARKDSSTYLLALSERLQPGDFVTSFYRQHGSTSILTGFVQVETGSLATSPIITNDDTASRAASSVVVDTSAVQSITVRYSDGTSDDYNTPDDTFSLPFAQKNWSERYIQEIVFGG